MEISSATNASAYEVKLQKKQSDQQEEIVNKVMESVEQTSPARTAQLRGTGNVVDVQA